MEVGTNAIIFQNDKHMAPVKDDGDIVFFQQYHYMPDLKQQGDPERCLKELDAEKPMPANTPIRCLLRAMNLSNSAVRGGCIQQIPNGSIPINSKPHRIF